MFTVDEAKKRCLEESVFDFYGLVVKVHVPTAWDVEFLHSNYPLFVSSEKIPSIDLYFFTEQESQGFFQAFFEKDMQCSKYI